MTIDVTDLVMTKYFIKEKEKEVLRINNEISELKKKLDTRCTHPAIVEAKVYTPGGYDHRSFVTVTHTCTICDKVVKEFWDPNHHGSYA